MAADDDVDYDFALTPLSGSAGSTSGSIWAAGSNEAELLKRYRQREEKRLRELVHEANNPLSVVQNYLHILEMRLEHDSSAAEQLGMISDGTEPSYQHHPAGAGAAANRPNWMQ